VPLRLLLRRVQASVSGLRVREHLLEPGVGRAREGVVSVEPRFRHAHPLTAKAQGMMLDLWLGPCGDCENPAEWSDLDGVLARATAAAKDVEEDRDAAEARVERVRAVLDDAWVRLSPDAEAALKEAIE